MQEPSSKKPNSRGYRVRPASSKDRLNSKVRGICSLLAVAAVLFAAGGVIHSLYRIQIVDGETYRQEAAEQQLKDITIKAVRGEIYDTSGITLASTNRVWDIWADPKYSTALYTQTGTEKEKNIVRTPDPAICAEVSRELTLRLLSGDGENLDAVDTSSEAYQQQYQTVYDALSKVDSSYAVLASKVNNAVKLSVEKYVSEFNKAHKKPDDGSRKGRISVSARTNFERSYP